MIEPLVSVIIPIYNTEPYLGYCLNSLVSQTYSNWQAILIDDGSTDGSRRIAQHYTRLDPRFQLHSTPNGGVSKARNLGLQHATGKYLHFLDSDDVLAPQTLEKQVQAAESTGKQLVVSDVLIADFTAPERKGPRLSAKQLNKKTVLTKEEFKENRMRLIWHTALLEGLYGKLYDRSLWERLQLRFPEDMNLGEDFVTNLRYYAACNGAVFLQKIGHYYNNVEGSDSLTHRYRPDLFETKMHLMEVLWVHLHTDNIPSEEERICFHNYTAGTGLLCIHEMLQTEALTKKEKRKRLAVITKHPLFMRSLSKAEYIPPAYEEYVPLLLWGNTKGLLLQAAKTSQTTLANRALRLGIRKIAPYGGNKMRMKLAALEQALAEHGIRHTFFPNAHRESAEASPDTKPIPTLITAGILLLSLAQLELSCGRTDTLSLPYLLLNLASLLSLHCFIRLFFRSGWIPNLLLTLLSTAAALINYYVIRFKGSPLSFLELRNLGTALNVIEGYHFPITETAACLLLLGGLSIALSLLHRKYRRARQLPWLLQKAVLMLIILLTLEIGYFGTDSLKPKQSVGWLWREAYEQYGYIPCTVESFFTLFHTVTVPAGYDAAAMDAIELPLQKEQTQQTPDIILILNESFYDLSLITNLNADHSYLHTDDLYAGYAVVPAYGGGTNSSEYELLTSNSMALLPGVTPFNILDLNGANSIVSHLNTLGYETLGCHSESGENYYRSRGYPALGFEHIYFDEDFRNKDYHHSRYYESDESLYKNLTRWYEEMSDSPRFLYLLTIQNHGSWDHNPSEADTVHARSDYGEYDDEVDEYLTAVSQSDAAFHQLTEHYANTDRPVIICMVGDHCPNFAEAVADRKYSAEELELLYRSTPLLIWSNFNLGNDDRDLGTMSLNMVVPTLLDLAGIPLSPYYQSMLELKAHIPILTAYGVCYDTYGNVHLWDENFPHAEAVRSYFYWEYNNLSDHRRQSLFAPYKK